MNLCLKTAKDTTDVISSERLEATKNARRENGGPAKSRRVKMQDMKMTDQITGHEIAGHENARHIRQRGPSTTYDACPCR